MPQTVPLRRPVSHPPASGRPSPELPPLYRVVMKYGERTPCLHFSVSVMSRAFRLSPSQSILLHDQASKFGKATVLTATKDVAESLCHSATRVTEMVKLLSCSRDCSIEFVPESERQN